MTEHQHQVSLFNFLRTMEYEHPVLKWVHAIPNGGLRHKAIAGKMKAEGLKAGVLDIFVPIPRTDYHGQYIEMKFGKNVLTTNQKDFMVFVSDQGYQTDVCYTWIEAAVSIFKYLGLDLPEGLP